MNKMHQMRSMELDDEDKIDACLPMPCETPDYPYGLCFTLTEKELKKLGLDASEAVEGGVIHGHFLARIRSVTHTEHNGEKTCRIENQIEDLAIESEDEENEEADETETAGEEAKERNGGNLRRRKSVLYG